ncbi:MAG: pyruvate dehydrogenase (acetyl-transferring), homodimeric type, partial [Planctomycetaceae bacterium]
HGTDRVRTLLGSLGERAARQGVALPAHINTPYVNTIPPDDEPGFPADEEIERRIENLIRWNAMAMVVRANRAHKGIGGHISSFASLATLYEVGFNHFFRARHEHQLGDLVYLHGHSSPGTYARAFLEGRLDEEDLDRFRRETPRETGLSSYPHPWLMPNFWQFPTVSMGLGPILAIYQARFLHYLADREILDTADARVWCFIGDGETDEPETLGLIDVAARERLDNLTFIINCNLQRLDGPVRGNGKIIQELEGRFRGARWNCIKIIWGSDWDPLFAADEQGRLVRRMEDVPDGQWQKYTVEPGGYFREDFFNSPELQALVEPLSDEELKHLTRGGHDPRKVYAAYHAALECKGRPTVVLAHTVKGYGLGEAGEGQNVTHKA